MKIVELKQQMKLRGITVKQLAYQSDYSVGFVSGCLRRCNDSENLPNRIRKSLESAGILPPALPTPKQIELLQRWGYEVPATQGECSALIAEHIRLLRREKDYRHLSAAV